MKFECLIIGPNQEVHGVSLLPCCNWGVTPALLYSERADSSAISKEETTSSLGFLISPRPIMDVTGNNATDASLMLIFISTRTWTEGDHPCVPVEQPLKLEE